MLFQTNTSRYIGQTITKITDSNGFEVNGINMDNELNFHFNNGEVLTLAIDWRGNDAYISQFNPRSTDDGE